MFNFDDFNYAVYKNEGNLQFDADFEYGTIGNLVKLGKDWYSIVLRENTWYRFYFRIHGCKGREIIFDFDCPYTSDADVRAGRMRWQFKEGFNRPYISYNGVDWERVGKIERVSTYFGKYRFSHFFTEDEAFISFNVPYTYTDLMNWLKKLDCNGNVTIDSIGRTRNGTLQPCISITNNRDSKEMVIIIGREDADEVGGSFAIEGLVDYLLNEDKSLLDRFVFKIIPMVGIDGVVAGATHSAGYGYSGFNWGKDISPREIENCKAAIRSWVNDGYEIKLAGKLHGASYPNVTVGFDDILACNPKVLEDLREGARQYYGNWVPGGYNADLEWEHNINDIGIRNIGYFERFIMDEFGTDKVFGTHVLEQLPDETRAGGKALMHGIDIYLTSEV